MIKEKELELRMYFFVPYQLTGIQQGIQAGHAALEYARMWGELDLFTEFVDNHKTWIILNGGTTNSKVRPGVISVRDEEDPYTGSLDNLYVKLIDWNMKHKDNQINYASFNEPDLNNALTAICFICDERVFNYEDYPNFMGFMKTKLNLIEWIATFKNGSLDMETVIVNFPKQYSAWVKSLGGIKNVYIRELLKGKKFA